MTHLKVNVTNLVEKREKICDMVVLIDVLRAGTSVATALNNGCKYILPFKSIKKAVEGKKRLGADAVLVGEHHGYTPKGFDLNNSPAKLREYPLKEKIICFRSSNLTRILEKIKCLGGVKKVLIGCLANAKAVAKYIDEISPGEVHIVICGNLSWPFNLEDFVGAGAVVKQLGGAELTDMAMAALLAYENKDSIKRLWGGRTAKHVVEIGFKEDMLLCIRENYINVVPEYRDGRIVLAKQKEYIYMGAEKIADLNEVPSSLENETFSRQGCAQTFGPGSAILQKPDEGRKAPGILCPNREAGGI